MPLIKLLVEGGSMKPGPAVAQQLGPMGINMGQVISDVNDATKEFKGMEVPVVLDVDAKTKTFAIEVKSPSVSALIKKEIGLEKASGERLKVQSGNMAIEQVISVTKQKFSNMLANEFIDALNSVIGSCMSMGLLIENKDPKEILEEIREGAYAEEIKSQKSEASPEKLKELKEFFADVSAKQQASKAAEEEEAKAAEEAKAEATISEGAKDSVNQEGDN